ncbi:MAG: hypothetical protein J6W76_01200 [Spirochaetales bacterium]|nr:hypothetical protein [Spirochaetales bacterium]
MNHIIKLTFCMLILLMTVSLASAETFYLKDGNKVAGDIVSHEDGIYTVNTSFGIVDIPDDNIDRISDKAAEAEEEVKEIKIAAKEIKRHFVPEYEDEKYHDPLYIAYHQAKTSAIALTASGATFFTIGILEAVVILPTYFALQETINTGIAAIVGVTSGSSSDADTVITTANNIGLALLLPMIVVPGALGFCLLMACIGPWVYASKLLYAWQSKYHVHMSMADTDKLELGFSISL